jgi:hypothetical protein
LRESANAAEAHDFFARNPRGPYLENTNVLGFPLTASSEAHCAGDTLYSEFQFGAIFFAPRTGAFRVTGKIWEKLRQWEQGPGRCQLGFPVGDDTLNRDIANDPTWWYGCYGMPVSDPMHWMTGQKSEWRHDFERGYACGYGFLDNSQPPGGWGGCGKHWPQH